MLSSSLGNHVLEALRRRELESDVELPEDLDCVLCFDGDILLCSDTSEQHLLCVQERHCFDRSLLQWIPQLNHDWDAAPKVAPREQLVHIAATLTCSPVGTAKQAHVVAFCWAHGEFFKDQYTRRAPVTLKVEELRFVRLHHAIGELLDLELAGPVRRICWGFFARKVGRLRVGERDQAEGFRASECAPSTQHSSLRPVNK